MRLAPGAARQFLHPLHPARAMLEPITKQDWNIFTAAHLLNRAGFGGTPETIANAFKLGPVEAVNRLLQAGATPAVPVYSL